jgi:hypothetical protein
VIFDYCRRFGVEAEVNAFDGLSRPAQKDTLPAGIQVVANVVAQTLNTRCEIYNWFNGQEATNSNSFWVVKPDGSCGMEVCSPVSKGLLGINQGAKVVAAMRDSGVITSDHRCSLHVHTEVADLTTAQIGSVLAYWIKCEYTMLLAMPDRRKKNRYCQPIGMSDLLRVDQLLIPSLLINRLGAYKYYTANAFHYSRNKRPTLEFRIADEEACMNPSYFRNWCKLIVHFVEVASSTNYPRDYRPDDPMSGYMWLYPEDTLKFLGFDKPDSLCPELRETRDWFIRRIHDNRRSSLGGIWDDKVVDSVWQPK